MIPAAEKGAYSKVTWSKANFSPVIKRHSSKKGSAMNALLFKLSNKIWIDGKVHFHTTLSQFLWNTQAQLTPANSLT